MRTMSVVIPEPPVPLLIRLLGGRFRDSRRSYRMAWGELAFRRGCALQLALFDDGFRFHVHALGVLVFLRLPFLNRFAWDPYEIMESWGVSATAECGIHLHWGRHTKVLTVPWRDWVHIAHEVRRADGSWVPFVGSWEEKQPHRPDGKDPDGRHVETHPYHYLLPNGDVQHVTATVSVERRTWKLRLLRWLPWGMTRHSIDVQFSDEVGERAGSWKGGCLGCGYDLRPNETPRECLLRMMREQRFT